MGIAIPVYNDPIRFGVEGSEERLAEFAEDANLRFRETDLLNDGGNFVDDYSGNVVISRKFLRDNKLTEAQARKKLRKLTGAINIAFIGVDMGMSKYKSPFIN